MPFCTKCGKPVSPTNKFCSNCGELQPVSPLSSDTSKVDPISEDTCRSCGNPLSPGITVCMFCGATRDNVPVSIPVANILQQSQNNAPFPPAQPSRFRKCPACGNTINPGDKYCSKCLVLVKDPILHVIPRVKSNVARMPENNTALPLSQPSKFHKCTACGNLVNPGDKYCSNCLVLVKDPLPHEIPPDELPPTHRQVFR